jgi:predicted N-acyltransferase
MMKETTARLTTRCPIYDTVQQLLQPEGRTSWCGRRPDKGAGQAGGTVVPLDKAGAQARVYRSALELPVAWDKLAAREQVFLSRNYLLAWEEAPPVNVEMAYVVVEQGEEAVGVVALQLVDFNIGAALPRWKRLNWGLRVLVCGAAQVSGPYGFAFSEAVPAGEQAALLEAVLQALRAPLGASAVMVKDLNAAQFPAVTAGLQASGYVPFRFEPNMVVEVAPDWHSLDDYLEAMTSKYRVRARRAFRKGAHLGCRSLTVRDLQVHEARLYALYTAVADRSDFSLLRLQPGYFARLKAAFGPAFKVIGYFDGDTLVGFCTVLRSGTASEVHFLGFDESYNASAQLYLNMLLASIRTGIEDFGSRRIVLGRTATVIKSSVGARPHTEQVWLRHSNCLVQALLPGLVRFLRPPMEAEVGVRHPFGE